MIRLNGIEYDESEYSFLGIPRRYRTEFDGKDFTDKQAFEIALMNARCAEEAILNQGWKWDIYEKQMRTCLATINTL